MADPGEWRGRVLDSQWVKAREGQPLLTSVTMLRWKSDILLERPWAGTRPGQEACGDARSRAGARQREPPQKLVLLLPLMSAPGSAIGFERTDLAIGNGAGCGTPPVGSNAAVDIPVIALFPAFLAFRASNCNGWARSWGSGAGMQTGPGKTMYRPENPGLAVKGPELKGAHIRIFLPLLWQTARRIRTLPPKELASSHRNAGFSRQR